MFGLFIRVSLLARAVRNTNETSRLDWDFSREIAVSFRLSLLCHNLNFQSFRFGNISRGLNFAPFRLFIEITETSENLGSKAVRIAQFR